MKVKRNNKVEYIELSSIICLILVLIYLFFNTDSHIWMVTIFMVFMYFITLVINGFVILKKAKIVIDKKELYVGHLGVINKTDFSKRLFSPFIKGLKHYTLESFNIELNEIDKIGFVKDLKSFNMGGRLDIGIIDIYKDKYVIPIREYREDDIIKFIGVISKSVKLTGEINNLAGVNKK